MALSTTNPVVRALRPEPHRGDQVAAGVVVLATLMLLVQVRFDDVWGDGARFVVAALAAGFVGAMAYLSPLESDRPRSYQSVLYVTTCLLALLALAPLATWLGAQGVTSPGALTWVMLLVGFLALTFSLRRNSAYCTLVAALAFMFCLQGAVQWIFDPDGASTARWVFVLVVLADLLGAVMLRDRRRRHAVMLADAAGIAVLGLALTLAGDLLPIGPVVDTGGGIAWGWALFGFGAGFGLVAYAGADREPGPGYLGVACLAVFAVLVGGAGEATLLGWPIFLALVAGAFLVVGLRPSHPLPPEPIEDVGEDPRVEPLPTPPERRPGALWQRIMPSEREPVVEEAVDAPEPAAVVEPEPAVPIAEPEPVVEPEPELVLPPPATVAGSEAQTEVAPAVEPEPEPEPEPTPEPEHEPAPPVVEQATEPQLIVQPPPPEPAVEPEPEAATDVTEPPAAPPSSSEPKTEPQLRPLPHPRSGQTPRLAPHPDAEDDTTRAYPTLDDDDEL